MSAEEFWHGDLELVVSYREAEKIRRQNRYDAEWRQGRYAYEALVASSRYFREFSEGVKHEYPSEPIFSTVEEQRIREEERAKQKMLNMRKQCEAMAIAINKKLRSQSEQGD